MRVLVWVVRLAVFFTLFAFALNNSHESSIHWFFGQEWRAPTVFIVLAAFGFGCAFGIFAMVPSWWRQRGIARRESTRAASMPVVPPLATATTFEAPITHPPRDGL